MVLLADSVAEDEPSTVRQVATRSTRPEADLGPATATGVAIALLAAMPRRNEPDPLSLAVGQRIRDLRLEEGMTIEQLASESATGSKGHISNIERGLVRPNINTLKQVADGLGVEPLDLMTFPRRSVRERLVDLTRHLSRGRIGVMVRTAMRWLGHRK